MDLFDKIGETLADTVDTVINTVESAATNTLETGASLLTGDLKGAGENLVESFTEPVGEVLKGASEFTENLSGMAKELGLPSTIVTSVDTVTSNYLPDGYFSEDGLMTSGEELPRSQGYYQSFPDYSYSEPASNEYLSVNTGINNQLPQSDINSPNANDNIPQNWHQDESSVAQAPKANTGYGNFESLKTELGLENMPTVSKNSYTMSEDTNGDGKIDYVYDRDNRSIPYHIADDTNGDGKVDSIYNRYDTDGDGYYETVVDAVDYNKDGNFDFAYKSYDTNGDGHHDSVVEVYDQNSNGYTDQKLVLNDNNHDGYFESEVAINDDGFYNA